MRHDPRGLSSLLPRFLLLWFLPACFRRCLSPGPVRLSVVADRVQVVADPGRAGPPPVFVSLCARARLVVLLRLFLFWYNYVFTKMAITGNLYII